MASSKHESSNMARSSDLPSEDDNSILVEDENGQADESFIDDLIAASDMKSYILSAGHDLEEEVIMDLNRLYSIFRSDIEARQATTESVKPPSTEAPDGPRVDSYNTKNRYSGS